MITETLKNIETLKNKRDLTRKKYLTRTCHPHTVVCARERWSFFSLFLSSFTKNRKQKRKNKDLLEASGLRGLIEGLGHKGAVEA